MFSWPCLNPVLSTSFKIFCTEIFIHTFNYRGVFRGGYGGSASAPHPPSDQWNLWFPGGYWAPTKAKIPSLQVRKKISPPLDKFLKTPGFKYFLKTLNQQTLSLYNIPKSLSMIENIIWFCLTTVFTIQKR